jgi:hypothetical protein
MDINSTKQNTTNTNETQHSQQISNGFHGERAGDTALLQLINVIEEAIELNTPLYNTS